ncbi:MAG TPA: SDR family NAD(P)-dependent oxidoreductase [Streptosporangiaceae bacterium]|nr:SDR family NAD(P)-dependent oxidoreductase [Streptosporangiaceae bacterium]
MESMTGRVALVAGASKGIGAATAEAFAAAGARVVLAARDLTALEGVAKRIADSGGQAIAVRTDVSDEDSMRNLAGRTVIPIDGGQSAGTKPPQMFRQATRPPAG